MQEPASRAALPEDPEGAPLGGLEAVVVAGPARAAQERSSRREQLEFELNELDKAELVAGEDEQLASERKLLTHAEKLKELYGPIDQLFSEFDQRLHRLPTDAQRASAAAESSKTASPELAPSQRKKLQELGYIESPSGTSEQRR